MGIFELYARVIGKKALSVLKEYNIKVEYDNITEYIINRKGDGICPMEQAVESIDEPNVAIDVLKLKLKSISQK